MCLQLACIACNLLALDAGRQPGSDTVTSVTQSVTEACQAPSQTKAALVGRACSTAFAFVFLDQLVPVVQAGSCQRRACQARLPCWVVNFHDVAFVLQLPVTP